MQNNNGDTTAVLIPIEEWHELTEKYNLEELPLWQKNLIYQRLEHLK